MSDFKFSCPSCSQRISANSSMSGHKIECPSCQATIMIPKAPQNPEDVPVAGLILTSPKLKKDSAPIATSAGRSPAADGGDPTKKKKSLVAAESMGDKPQIGALTPEVKLEIIRAVRKRIADESHWIRRRNEKGQYTYAVKDDGETQTTVSVTDPAATRFSLLGAILLEFENRNVIRTASGRNRFLDGDVVEAIIEVGTGKPFVPEYQGARPRPGADSDIALNHKQTLEVIDILENRYIKEIKGEGGIAGPKDAKHTRLADLLRKIERKEELTTEEVTTAFHFELKYLEKRLGDIERSLGR